MCSLIQIQGHNRARQRDKLGQALEELANLQEEVSQAIFYNNNLCTQFPIKILENGLRCVLTYWLSLQVVV